MSAETPKNATILNNPPKYKTNYNKQFKKFLNFVKKKFYRQARNSLKRIRLTRITVITACSHSPRQNKYKF